MVTEMKNLLMKRIPLLCMVLMLILCMIFTGCASRKNLTVEEFSSICAESGYTMEDTTAQFDPSTLTTALTYYDEQTSIGYFTFSAASSAKANYAQFLSDIKTGASGEKYVDSTEYNRFYVQDDTSLTLIYRNGSTLIYVTGMDTEALDSLIDTLGI